MSDEDFKKEQAEKVRLDQQEDRDDLGRVSGGAQGNRMHKGFVEAQDATAGIQDQTSSKDNELYQLVDMVMSTQERIHAQFQESIQNAREFSNKAGKQLETHSDNLDQLKADLEENTVTLDNGLGVYRQGDQFYYQDAQNNWHRLENEAQIAEAAEKEQSMIAEGKTPRDKQYKENVDQYEMAVLDAKDTRDEYDRMREQFEENVEKGIYDPEEKKALDEKKNEVEEKLDAMDMKNPKAHNKVNAELNKPEVSSESYNDFGQSFFSTPAPEEPQGSGISAAEPVIKSDVQLKGDFKMAASGEESKPEQRPTMEPKEPVLPQPNMG